MAAPGPSALHAHTLSHGHGLNGAGPPTSHHAASGRASQHHHPPPPHAPSSTAAAIPAGGPAAGPVAAVVPATSASTPTAAQTTAAETHNAAIRGVIEKGSQLNAEAARDLGYSPERRAVLPSLLQKYESESEAALSVIGNLRMLMEDPEKAVRAYEEALRKNPYSAPALLGLVRYHKKVGNDARVVEYSQRYLALDESGAAGEVWQVIGQALLVIGHLPHAYSCYQQAIAKTTKKDDPELWYGIGILYDRYGSMEHAEEAFASVLKLDPNFHKRDEIFFRLGIIYKLQGRADASLECFRYILDAPPPPLKDADVWYQIGHALELKQDLVASREAYERVLRTTPDHAKVLQHLGGLYLRENTPFYDPERVLTLITQSLEHDAHDPFSWYLLGRAFMQLSNYGKSYEAYQQAVYRDGKNPAYWCSIGVLYFNINQYHDALDAYTRAVRIHPFIPEIWQNLGILYESCHDQLNDAMDAYQRAAQLDPNNPTLNRRLQEVRFAVSNNVELQNPPPRPQDIMPDSRSWASAHFDVSGAKPVYLDQRALAGGHISPDSATAMAGAPVDARFVASPPPFHPSAAGTAPGGPGAAVGPAHPHHPSHQAFHPQNANPAVLAGGRPGPSAIPSRNSLDRPGSSHSAIGHNQAFPPPPGHSSHPHQPYPFPEDRSRHPPNAVHRGHPHLTSSVAAIEADRERDAATRRSAGGSLQQQHHHHRAPGHQGSSGDRDRGVPSPSIQQESSLKHAISPSNSPRTRPPEYEYGSAGAASRPGHHHHHHHHLQSQHHHHYPGNGSSLPGTEAADWARTREAEMDRDRAREGDQDRERSRTGALASAPLLPPGFEGGRERNGSRQVSGGHSQQTSSAQRHHHHHRAPSDSMSASNSAPPPGPSSGKNGTSNSAMGPSVGAGLRQSRAATSAHDRDPARRPVSPSASMSHPSGGPGGQGQTSGYARQDGRAAGANRGSHPSGPSRSGQYYSYDYYPSLSPGRSHRPQSPPRHYDVPPGYDPRYDTSDPRERELAWERSLQARRAAEEEDRRRRELEASRRELSPTVAPINASKDEPRRDRRGPGLPPMQTASGNSVGGRVNGTPGESGLPSGSKARNGKAVGADEPGLPSVSAGAGSSHAAHASHHAQPLPPKERKRKSASHAVGDAPHGRTSLDAGPGKSRASPTSATYQRGEAAQQSRMPVEDYDDETDTAAVLMGLAGAAMGAGASQAPALAAGAGGDSGIHRRGNFASDATPDGTGDPAGDFGNPPSAGKHAQPYSSHKRSLSGVDDGPAKKARPEGPD